MKITLEVPDGYRLEIGFTRTDSGAKQAAEGKLRQLGYGGQAETSGFITPAKSFPYPGTASGGTGTTIFKDTHVQSVPTRRLSFTDYESSAGQASTDYRGPAHTFANEVEAQDPSYSGVAQPGWDVSVAEPTREIKGNGTLDKDSSRTWTALYPMRYR